MNKRIIRSLLIHMFIVWIVLTLHFVLPYVFYKISIKNDDYLWKGDGTSTTTFEHFLLITYYHNSLLPLLYKLLIFIPLVEGIYWYLFKPGLTRKAIIASICAGILISVLLYPWNAHTFLNYPLLLMQMALTYAGYAMVYGFIRKSLHERRVAKDMKLQRAENELNALKSQLNPHFFLTASIICMGRRLMRRPRTQPIL